MATKNYVTILQEMERQVLDRCNRHRKEHNLSSLVFSEDCEKESCSEDCPFSARIESGRRDMLRLSSKEWKLLDDCYSV